MQNSFHIVRHLCINTFLLTLTDLRIHHLLVIHRMLFMIKNVCLDIHGRRQTLCDLIGHGKISGSDCSRYDVICVDGARKAQWQTHL